MKIILQTPVLFFCFVSGATSMLGAQNKITKDTVGVQAIDEIVISASRTSESIMKSPVSIESVNSLHFKNSASPSFFDALENVKGVQMLVPSLGFKIINTRGFANTTNVRFTQLVDGFDNQAPHIGAPIGNAMGPGDLDIERVEIIPGTASALYGLNSVNGLANFITKDPFVYRGITVQQKAGVNHLNSNASDVTLFTENSIRIAEKLSDRFAVKLNGTFTKGSDWIADDRTDLNPSANANLGIAGGVDNPAYDPVNGYGNESSNRRTLTLAGRRYVVARTGYSEKDLTDYNIQNIKADISLHYKIRPKTLLTYTYRFADLDNVYQRANRFVLKDYIVQQHSVELKNDIFQIKAFLTTENTGKSFNLRSAAENLDRSFKSDNVWYNDYAAAFNSATANPGTGIAQALNQARAVADDGRLQPGTALFKSAVDRLADINNWDEGAALRVRDQLLHAEGQLDVSNLLGPDFKKNTGLDLLIGADYQSYIIDPDGNYFINPAQGRSFDTFSYGKTGSFVQAGKNMFQGLLKLSATLRADKNDYFDVTFNPRIAAVVAPSKEQSIRMSFQSGSRFPSIFEAFSNVNSGGVKRVGGLRIMSNGVFENAYLRSSIDGFQAAVTSDFNSGTALSEAIEQRKYLLVKNTYTYLNPEHINSFEAGYKGFFLQRNLKVDADFYFNKYDNFIAQVEMNVPNTTDPSLIPTYLNDRSKQSRYRMYTNSQSRVYNFGASLGLSYLFWNHYTFSGNVSYARLSRTENNDGFEDGFNTPEWTGNVSFSGENLFQGIGFSVSYRQQSSFYWRSFLVNGNVKPYGTLDAQISYDLSQAKMSVKIGATNLTNTYYNSFLGGPSIGGFYYTAVTYKL
ncbi:TonB-dependent receptor plug domain-containing protein [Chryseobacterium sp. JJR-5R]|uniref:TonB-dependent receptor n=1 Tax=Chryseobacterium sp. JJR-5R TaxID=3093923 RepID=UPI002A764B82|nr:TonB-dependent receptor [Chryseobacterium sp. JJR-5R]WPO84137.1 TonB-dependent receptor plug domain-containing protein [Chryseobacterium sp. JJR-5R]